MSAQTERVTPWPWTTNGASVLSPISDTRAYQVAVVYGVNPHVRAANARLIAAAPETAAERDRLKAINAELLEALRSVLACNPEPGRVRFLSDAEIAQVRAAIAKAEGGES